MQIKCPKCKSNRLNASKSIFRPLPVFATVAAVLVFISVWNFIAALKGRIRYTCLDCGKSFK